MKYNIGDVVRIKSWEQLVEEYGHTLTEAGNILIRTVAFNPYMRQYCEKEYVIEKAYILPEEENPRYILKGCSPWIFLEEMFQSTEEYNEELSYDFTFADFIAF